MLKQLFQKLSNTKKPSTYIQLSKHFAQHLEGRKQIFSVDYVTKNDSLLDQDVKNAIKFLDITSPYCYRLIKKHRYTYTNHGSYYTIKMTITYETTDEEEVYVDQQLSAIAQHMLKENQSDLDLVKAVHDFVILNFTYNIDTKRSPYVVHTLFVEGQGVCQAMALFAFKLFKKLGIPCYYVTGRSERERHGWNLVQLDGIWYHLDITWDNPNFSKPIFENDRISYNYFLLSDAQIQKDHMFDTLYYPPANSEQYSAFHQVNESIQIGEDLYFPNDEANQFLYKLNMKTLEVSPVLHNRVQFLSRCGDELYFSNYSDSGHLYSYKLRTKQLKKLYYYEVTNTLVKDNCLYIENAAKDIITIPLIKGV